jgi:predicted RND superfamily exporter protein
MSVSFLSQIWGCIFRNRFRSRLVLVLITLPALLATATLELDPRWTNALPREDPLIDEFLQVVEDPLRGSTVYAVVDGPGALNGAREFAEAVRDLPHVRFVHGLGDEVLPHELMFLPEEDFAALVEFTENLDVGDLIMAGATGSEESGALTAVAVPSDDLREFVFGTLDALADALEGGPHISTDDLVAPLFRPLPGMMSGSGSAVLVRVETDFSENSIEGLPEFVEALRDINKTILNEPPHPRIRLTGYPVTAHDEVRAIETSSKRLTLWALFIIAILMKLILGSLRSALHAIGVLLISFLWVLGLTRLVFGEMNTVTMIMGMVLIGLGIDFCIHWQNHHRLGLAAGLRGELLARHVFETASPPIMAGAVTTAGAFLCVLIMDVPSLQEFSILSAGGVLLTAFVVLFAMPVLVPEDGRESRSRTRVAGWTVSVARIAMGRPQRVLAVFVVLLLASGLFLRNLDYDYNYSRLQIGGLPSYKLKQEIIQRFGLSSDILVHRARGVGESARVDRELDAHPQIARVESISDYLLDDDEHEPRAARVTDLMQRLEGRPAHRYTMDELRDLRQELLDRRRSGFKFELAESEQEDFERFGQILRRFTAAVDDQTLDVLNDFNRDLRRAFRDQVARRADTGRIDLPDLPSQVRAGFTTSEPGVYLQYIFPTGDLWEKEPAGEMEAILTESAPGAVGLSRISYRLMDIMLGQGLRMAAMALVVVLVALRIALKNWSLALMASVPLLMGGVLTAGTLSLAGVRVNFYNLVGVPIFLGIGIDDGVHLINAYRRQTSPDSLEAVRATGAAILLTSLTSMVGFGCLSFYQHPGMASLGIFLFVGVGWCLVTTLVLLPVLLRGIRTTRGMTHV